MSAPGAYVFGCAGLRLSQAETAFFRQANPVGFILFSRNIENPDQLRALTSALRDCVGRDAPVLIDQEGGRVARLKPPHWRAWMAPLAQMEAAGPELAARSMRLRYRLIAAELHDLGIDVNCAPVADIAEGTTHPFLRDRCYGSDLPTVIGAARAVAQGLLEGGVLPVVKHVPGHGRAAIDSHHDVPVVGTDAETLRQSDFAAFRALADLPIAMTAHVVYAAIDGAVAATCSPAMVALIRDEIGFDGLLLSDDLSMRALSGPIPHRAERSIAAGCDVALHCNGDLAEMEAVASVLGPLTVAATRRAAAALARRQKPQPVDLDASEAELRAILSGDAG